MKKARDPLRRDLITVFEYGLRFGNKLDDAGNPNERLAALCPGCEAAMHTKGENNYGSVDAIFSHAPAGWNAPWCPLKESAAFRYQHLTPVAPDVEAGRRLRANFMRNWRLHWSLIKWLVPYPDIEVFIKWIHTADKLNIWQHRNFPENMVPYVLVTLGEIRPPTGKPAMRADARKHTVRFMFDGRVRGIDDLWIRANGAVRLLEARYKPAIPPERVASELIDIFDREIDLDFLSKGVINPPNAHQIKRMWEEFSA